MFDIGWTELLVIAIVLIVVVGPKDLPPMLRAFGKMTSNLRKMAGDFRAQFDEALRESELDDVRRTISDAQRLNPTNALREAINPLRQMGQDIRNDLQKSTQVPSATDRAQTDVEAQQAVEGASSDPFNPALTPEASEPLAAPVAPVVSAPLTPPVAASSLSVGAANPSPASVDAVASKPKRVRKTPAAAQEAEAEMLPRPKRPRSPKPAADDLPSAGDAEAVAKPRRRVAKKSDTPKDEA